MPDETTPPPPRPPRKRTSRANAKASTSSKRKPSTRSRKAKPIAWPKISLPGHLKTTLILLVAVVGLGTYISLYELKQPTSEELEYRAMTMMELTSANVTKLTLDLPVAKFAFNREGAVWRVEGDGTRVDADRITRILQAVDPLRADRMLTPDAEQVLDPAAYGLNPPIGQITFTAGDEETILLIGDTTPVPGQRYAKLPNKSEIYVIPVFLLDEANQTAEIFRDPLLLRYDIWSTDKLAMQAKESGLELTRNGKVWQLLTPVADVADRTEVNRLLTDLSGIPIAQVNPKQPVDKKGRPRSPFEPAAMEATITLQGPAPGPPGPDGVLPERIPQTPITVVFGEPLPDDPKLIYAQRSDETALYAVDAAVLERLKRDPHELRSKAVMEFFVNMVTKVQLAEGEEGWTVERKDGSWVDPVSGTVLDLKQVDNWLSSLADTRVAGFVDDTPSNLKRYGLEPPQITVSIWTMDSEAPQQLFLGTQVDNTDNRHARIAGREAVVRLPGFITDLLAMDLEDFQVIVAVPATEAGTVTPQ